MMDDVYSREPCGCGLRTVHTALSGWDGDTEIVRCPLHDAAPVLLAACRKAKDGCGGLLWLRNNMHNYGTDDFKRFLEAAIEDASEGYHAAEAAIATATNTEHSK